MTRHLYSKPSWPGYERLIRLRRWPSLKRFWEGRQVMIYSNEYDAYWRKDGCGYSKDRSEAGIWEFEDAFNLVSHCGPEKAISFFLVEPSNPL